jgi:hypothetical protein
MELLSGRQRSMPRLFLLSPANCSGRRAAMLMSPNASFDLAVRLRSGDVTLGEAFTFLSGLYFRGKIAYARAFANAPDPAAPLTGGGALVITTSAGLRSPDTPITLPALRAFARCSIGIGSRTYRRALEASARGVRDEVGESCQVVLLGSIASPKYVDVLLGIFGHRLYFPETFVGRGDMSRGGLMLRAAAAGEELRYVPVLGASLHGQRPPKLPPLARNGV